MFMDILLEGSIGSPARSNVIDKFSFVTNVNATDVGNLTVARYGQAGQSSTAVWLYFWRHR